MATTTQATLSADELLAKARAGRPHVRYAKSRSENAIGAFDETLGRWVAVAALTLLGTWHSLPHELLVNDKPVYDQADWIE